MVITFFPFQGEKSFFSTVDGRTDTKAYSLTPTTPTEQTKSADGSLDRNTVW